MPDTDPREPTASVPEQSGPGDAQARADAATEADPAGQKRPASRSSLAGSDPAIQESLIHDQDAPTAPEALKAAQAQLQSAREEVEAMNQELQTLNQEMEAIRHELRRRTQQLSRAGTVLDATLRNLRAGVAVVDSDLRVVAWHEPADDVWGMRAEDAEGRSLLALDIGIPQAGLEAPLRACLARSIPRHELVTDAHDRRGRSFRCRLVMSPLIDADGQCGGAIVVMEHWDSTTG